MVAKQRPHADKTHSYLDEVDQTLREFKDEITCINANIRRKAFQHFLDSLKAAYSTLYTQVSTASVDIILDTIEDKDNTWFQELPNKVDPPGLTSASMSVKKTRHTCWRGYTDRTGKMVSLLKDNMGSEDDRPH